MNEEDADRAVGRLLREHATRHRAGDALQSAVRTEIALEAAGQRRQAAPPVARRWHWPAWGLAAAGFACGVLATAITLHLLPPADGTRALEQELASSHVRALMVAHLTDVASSDQHTVKPWFQGKLDYSPPVKDLAGDGYPLIGGRLDYVAARPVAALVYRRHGHLINLFVWPADGQAAPALHSHQGYQLAHWRKAGMQFWAVSDLNGEELLALARLIP